MYLGPFEPAEVASIELVKVDVEGWEAHVLTGAVNTLARTRNMLIEINHGALRLADSSQIEVLDLLREAGFTKFMVVPRIGLRRLFRGDPITNYLVSRVDTR